MEIAWESDLVAHRIGGSGPRAALRCGLVSHPAGHRELDFVTAQYALVYLVAGEGSYRDASGVVWDLRPGVLFQRFPNEPHTVRMSSATRKAFVGVPVQVLELLRLTGQGQLAEPVLEVGLSATVVDSFRRAARDLRDRPPGELFRSLLHLQQLILDLHAAAARTRWQADDDWLAEARAVLAAELARPLRLPAVARRLRMSYTSFRRAFTARVGIPPAEYRRRCRVERAMQLLLADETPLKQIAARLGYPDAAAFTTQFRQVAGVTPSAFRAGARI
ncbi:MAG: helix-turn-helix domain-containing protein [Fimbriimonadaceae bacterium]|nr:helix-turn-helix domain-containing protein [Fimbriimonadaceae bacterium]